MLVVEAIHHPQKSVRQVGVRDDFVGMAFLSVAAFVVAGRTAGQWESNAGGMSRV